MNENRKTQKQLWKQFQWLGMLMLAVCLLWCNVVKVKAEDVVIQCGDNCYGTLAEDGTLTISGTGKMWDYESGYKSAFAGYKDKILHVVIGDGITKIGDYAFGGYPSGSYYPDWNDSFGSVFHWIESVSIGTGVQEIGKCSFSAARELKSIDIPGNVQTIGYEAFSESNLEQVTFHPGLKTIGKYAFFGANLTSVELPDGLRSVEEGAFRKDRMEETEEIRLKVFVPEHVTVIRSGAFGYVDEVIASRDVILTGRSFRGGSITYLEHSQKLSFNACGGTVGTKEKTVLAGSEVDTLPTPTRTNYTFLGWYTARTGGMKYDSSTVMPAKNITLYAHWEKLSVGRCSRPTVTNVKTRKAIIKIKPMKNAKGYEYAWSLRKDMKKATTKTIHGTKLTISRLTKNKTYYVRVRAYRNGTNGKKIYGKWSDIRTVKIKK